MSVQRNVTGTAVAVHVSVIGIKNTYVCSLCLFDLIIITMAINAAKGTHIMIYLIQVTIFSEMMMPV